ncbi:MAG: Zn-ribbon domain-containing OB-fold protein [Sporichthyaceae bacterium]
MAGTMPAVDYLVLDEGRPHLRAWFCTSCDASYFDRRNACARCFGEDFERRDLGTEGIVRAFTIVHRAAPGLAAPYTSVVVDLDGGGSVKANLLGVTDPAAVTAQLKVRLVTFVAGTDDDGVEAVAFGFEPIGGVA